MSTLLSVGGWDEGSDKYSKMVSSPASRKMFVDSAVKLLKEQDFDGLDLDWYDTQVKFNIVNVLTSIWRLSEKFWSEFKEIVNSLLHI